jgi:hypothetical protein
MPVEQGQFIVTPEIVQQAVNALRQEHPKYEWGRGEFRNSVFERLVTQFGLPWRRESIGEIPDFSDSRVQELSGQLNGFQDLLKF